MEAERRQIERIQAGDQAAFGRVYDQLFPGVYGYARSRLPSDQIAEDLVSTTFLAVVDRMASFEWRGAGSFRAWVFRILRNQIANYYRSKSRIEETELKELVGSPQRDIGSVPEAVVTRDERRAALLGAIDDLSPRQREVIQLRYFGGLRNRDIARLLAVDERTISAYLSRGLKALEEKLAVATEVSDAG